MQPKSTPGSVVSFCLRFFMMTLVLLTVAKVSFSQADPSAKNDLPAGAVISQPRIAAPRMIASGPVNPADNDLGIPNKSAKASSFISRQNLTDRTQACTFSGSLAPGDATMPLRLFRGGVAGVCGTPQAFPGTAGAGPYYYDAYTIRNTTGACQCVTFTLTSSDATTERAVRSR